MNAAYLALQLADRAQANFARRLAEQQTSGRSQQIAIYRGYKADLGLHNVELSNGQIVNTRSTSNAALALGQRIACSFPQGAIGYIREMCR